MSRRKLLGDRYRIGEVIGQGAFASVYSCDDVETANRYAVKILNKQQLRDAGMEDAFEREIAAMKMLQPSPHVTNLTEVLQSTRNYYLIMDIADGGNLLTKIAKNDGLPGHVIRKYFKQLLSGLKDIHDSGVVHRDIKPDNLLLDDYRELRIADFSFACVADDQRVLKRQCGTPHYVAPEVLEGDGYNGAKADIWSVGVTLYVMIFGQLPFVAPDTDRLYQRICHGKWSFPLRSDGSCKAPESLRHLISVCIRRDPIKRWTIDKLLRHPWVLGKEHLPKSLRMVTAPEVSGSLSQAGSTAFPVSGTSGGLGTSAPFGGGSANSGSGGGGPLATSIPGDLPSYCIPSPDGLVQGNSFALVEMSSHFMLCGSTPEVFDAYSPISPDKAYALAAAEEFVQLSRSCPAIVWKKYMPGNVLTISKASKPKSPRTTLTSGRVKKSQSSTPTPNNSMTPTTAERSVIFYKRLSWEHLGCALHLMVVLIIVLATGFLRLLFDINVDEEKLPGTIKDWLESALTPPNAPASPVLLKSAKSVGSPSFDDLANDGNGGAAGTSPGRDACHSPVEASLHPSLLGLVGNNMSLAASATTDRQYHRVTEDAGSRQSSFLAQLSTDDDLVDTLKKGSLVHEKGDWRRRPRGATIAPTPKGFDSFASDSTGTANTSKTSELRLRRRSAANDNGYM